MRAGLLKHTLHVCRYLSVQSASGEESKVAREIARLRAALLRTTGNFATSAEEQHDMVNLVFETWYVAGIKDSDIVKYNDQDFRITLIEHAEFDRTMKLHLRKINE